MDTEYRAVTREEMSALDLNARAESPDLQLAEERQRLIDNWARGVAGERCGVDLQAQIDLLRGQAIVGELSLDGYRKGLVVALRASRPKPPPIYGSSRDEHPQVLEAALCLSCGLTSPEKHFRPEVLEAADKHHRGLGLQEVLLLCAAEAGYTGRPKITTANCREILKAGFSTHTLTTLLSTTGNKLLLDGFTAVSQAWREVAAIGTVSDFKTKTSYRLTADLEYEEVGPAGQLHHGTLGQETYTQAVKTYAKMLALTRQDIINDDLGAFNDLRRRFGIGAAVALNKIIWTTWLSASNGAAFWTGARGNLVTGSALAEAGLNTAIQAFRSAVGSDGNLLSLEPDRLLVPPDLEATGRKLYVSQKMRDAAGTAFPTANIMFNRFKPVVVPELSNAAYTGNSATTWWLLCNPAILASIVVSFLQGQQNPTIESTDADFDTLGIQFRGYHEFGADMSEYRASVKAEA